MTKYLPKEGWHSLVSPPTSLSLASKNDLRYMLKKKPITALSALHGQDISEEFLKNEKAEELDWRKNP